MTAASFALTKTDCGHCGFAEEGMPGQYVASWGNPNSPLVVVGEAPGATEVEKGMPFLGPSGKLLWTTLGQLNVPRSQAYTTNAMLCAPPLDKKPGVKEVRACRLRLVDEMGRLPGRKVILALGTKAANSLRDDKMGIAALSGRVEWSDVYGCWIAYAYHPAAILRNPSLYVDFVWALKQTVRHLSIEGPPPPLNTDIVYNIITNATQAVARIKQLTEYPKLVCDIETTGLDPRNGQFLSVGFAWSDNDAYILPADLLDYVGVRGELKKLLENTDILWIYHNGKFDTSWIRVKLAINALVGADTMLMHYCLDERSGGEDGGYHDLKRLSHKYCGAPAYADDIDSAHMESVPKDKLYEYQAYDLCYTYRLHGVLDGLLRKEPPSRENYPTPKDVHDKFLVRAANMLSRVEQRGMMIDRNRMIRLQSSYLTQIDEARKHISTTAPNIPENFNPASWVQVGKVLYTPRSQGGMGYPNLKHTDEATLHELQRLDTEAGRPPNAFLEAVLNYRSLVHTKSTYLDGIENRLDNCGILRTNILIHGTTSGRWSSRNPNCQNIPADSAIKELFIPSRPDYIMCNADYRRLELVTLAWYSRDPVLARDVMSDDFHWMTANKMFADTITAMENATLFGLEEICRSLGTFADFARRQASDDTRTNDREVLYDWMKTRLRRQAKFVNFGKVYGEGAVSLANPETGLGVSIQEAEYFSKQWEETYHVAWAWLLEQARIARSTRWIESASGRRRRFLYPPNAQTHITNEAMNHPIQSFAADINSMAMLKLERLLPEKGLGDVLLPVHDSILSEIPIERQAEAIQLIEQTMSSVVLDDLVQFNVDIHTGPTWGHCH